MWLYFLFPSFCVLFFLFAVILSLLIFNSLDFFMKNGGIFFFELLLKRDFTSQTKIISITLSLSLSSYFHFHLVLFIFLFWLLFNECIPNILTNNEIDEKNPTFIKLLHTLFHITSNLFTFFSSHFTLHSLSAYICAYGISVQ